MTLAVYGLGLTAAGTVRGDLRGMREGGLGERGEDEQAVLHEGPVPRLHGQGVIMGADYYFEADLGGKDRVRIYDSVNFTYNLGAMFRAAYPAWEWDMICDLKAKHVAPILITIKRELLSAPDKYRALNPPNGWGSYETMLEGLDRMIAYCEEAPEAWVTGLL